MNISISNIPKEKIEGSAGRTDRRPVRFDARLGSDNLAINNTFKIPVSCLKNFSYAYEEEKPFLGKFIDIIAEIIILLLYKFPIFFYIF